MYQTITLENSSNEIASVHKQITFSKQQIEETGKPQNTFLIASVEKKAIAYDEAVTFALFLVMIIMVVSITAYSLMEIAYRLAELNHNQALWFSITGEI